MTIPIDPRIFRAYDIRGKAEEQITREACFHIAQAFGTELRERYSIEHPRVCVGRDARLHGPGFEQAVIEGLCESDCFVLAIGQTPSPVNYFTICTEKLDGGIQVTASHNPAEDNGLKLSIRDAEAFSGDDLQELRTRIEGGRMRSGDNGQVHSFDALKPYADRLIDQCRGIGKGLSIVIDAGNGVAGPLYCDVLRDIGTTLHELYTEPDGTFPNHPADPSKRETLVDAQGLVRETGSHIGLAFDGDGDRLGIIDETGTIRSADEVLLLLAQDHLQRYPNAPVIFTVSNSGALESEIKKWRGRPVMTKVGHAFVEHTMREHQALLGGEQSGHFFCAEDYFAFDDALVAALRVMRILQKRNMSLSHLMAHFPKVYQSTEVRPFCPDERKSGIVNEAVTYFKKSYPVIDLDGARIDFGDNAWVGIRQSNTAPRLSICMEARSEVKLREIEDVVMGYLRTFPEIEWSV